MTRMLSISWVGGRRQIVDSRTLPKAWSASSYGSENEARQKRVRSSLSHIVPAAWSQSKLSLIPRTVPKNILTKLYAVQLEFLIADLISKRGRHTKRSHLVDTPDMLWPQYVYATPFARAHRALIEFFHRVCWRRLWGYQQSPQGRPLRDVPGREES